MLVLNNEYYGHRFEQQKQEEEIIPDYEPEQVTHSPILLKTAQADRVGPARASMPVILFDQECKFVKVFEGNPGTPGNSP